MYDVRRELGVMSIRYKIEKRVLERIGHVMRMDDDRTVKAAVLGWVEDLESLPKLPGKKRKTILYWKQLLREAQIDATNIGQLTRDRKEWKALVRARMRHIKEWEINSCHRVERERGQRTSPPPSDFACIFEGCDKVCYNKAGLAVHRRKVHEISKGQFFLPRMWQQICTRSQFEKSLEILQQYKGIEPKQKEVQSVWKRS